MRAFRAPATESANVRRNQFPFGRGRLRRLERLREVAQSANAEGGEHEQCGERDSIAGMAVEPRIQRDGGEPGR